MSMTLRDAVQKLAADEPHLRAHLLPLLKKAGNPMVSRALGNALLTASDALTTSLRKYAPGPHTKAHLLSENGALELRLWLDMNDKAPPASFGTPSFDPQVEEEAKDVAQLFLRKVTLWKEHSLVTNVWIAVGQPNT